MVPLPLQYPCVCRDASVVGGGGAGVPGQGRHGSARDRRGQPDGTRYGQAPVGVVVNVAGCADQGAVINAGKGWPEHDRREDVGAVDDRGGDQRRGDEQLGASPMPTGY